MTGVDSWVGFPADNLADGLSDAARDSIRGDCGKDDHINTGVGHPVVGEVVVCGVVDRSIVKFVFFHEIFKKVIAFVANSGTEGGIGITPYKDQGVWIFITKFVNGVLKDRKLLHKLSLFSCSG